MLANGTFAPGTGTELVQRTLGAGVRPTAELYLDRKIDQWYSLANRPGVAFILSVTDSEARERLMFDDQARLHRDRLNLLLGYLPSCGTAG